MQYRAHRLYARGRVPLCSEDSAYRIGKGNVSTYGKGYIDKAITKETTHLVYKRKEMIDIVIRSIDDAE